MPVFNQKGITSIFLILILLVGLFAGVYLVQHPQIFKSWAYESGEVKFINDFKKPYKNNTTTNIFVRLAIKPPVWQEEVTDPDQYEYPVLFRISFDPSKMAPEADCEITGDPQTNCQEIMLEKPIDKTDLTWVLPKKSGENQIYVRFFSNKLNEKDLSASIVYKDGSEIGPEVPAFLIGLQSLASSVFDIFRKVPGTATINATTLFITHVYTAGEEIITLSQAQQLGFDIDFSVTENGEIEFLYDPEQFSKLNLALEFFPEEDTITGEPRLVFLPKTNPTEWEDTLQASLEAALGETGGRLAGNLINKGVTKASQSKTIRSIVSKYKVPKKEGRPPTSAGFGSGSTGSFKRIAGLGIKNIAKMNPSEQYIFRQLLPLLRNGEAFPLDPEFARPILGKLLVNVQAAYKSSLKLNKYTIMDTVDNNWIIVIPNRYMNTIFGYKTAPNGFAAGRFIVINDSVEDIERTLAHELVHVISTYGKFRTNVGTYFLYNQDQADTYGAVMSQIYELYTDQVVKTFFGKEGVYALSYPHLHKSLTNLIENLMQATRYKVTHADFSVFALTGDDKQLMKTLMDNGVTPEQFMRILNRDINGAKLTKIMNDYYKTRDKTALVRAGAIGGGSAVFIGTMFAASARGEELPADFTIIYDQPDEDVDISVTDTTVNVDQNSCTKPYPQCAGTTGLENYIQGHTIMVTPVCDNSGNILSYNTKDLGNMGECQ